MTPDLASFLTRFRYRADARDRWTLLSGPGLVYGDCEDFALTVAWLLAGQSWLRLAWWVLTCRVVFWAARIGDAGHMMLWARGHGWIDNNYPAFGAVPRFRRSYPLWVVVGLKLLKR